MSIVRVSMRNPVFRMEGNNNAYLVHDGGELAVVDGGVAATETREQLEAAIADRGFAVEDVDRVLLTHWHPDHAGLAGFVQDRSGATVHVHEADAGLVAGDREARRELVGAFADAPKRWRVSEEQSRVLGDRFRPPNTGASTDGGRDGPPGTGGADDGPAVDPIEDGDRLAVGSLQIEAVHAPGHTLGETVFAVDDGSGRSEAFTGDALLPEYTPNIGGADPRVENALSAHLDTLRRIAAAGYDRGLPGHREPMADPAGRARTVISHHEDRAADIVRLLGDDGPLDTWDVAAEIFGDLHGHHLPLALGETHAHLAYLDRHDVLDRDDAGYHPRNDGLDRLSDLFPTG